MSKGNKSGNGTKREELHKKLTPKSGSGLPTPEQETKRLPEVKPSRVNSPEAPPSHTTTRAGKAPEGKRSQMPDITPTEDMISIGTILCGMNQNVTKLENALQGLRKQAASLTELHAPMKLQEEFQAIQQQLRQQIQRQNEEIKQKQVELESLLIRQLDEKIRKRIDEQVQEIVKETVASRIQTELDRLIPAKLKTQSERHRKRTLQISSNLFNNEARRRNANARTERLHPLVITRSAAISRSSSGSTATPSTAGGLLATPLDSNGLQLFFNASNQPDDSYLVSQAFPSNPQVLFYQYLNDKESLRQLLEDYEGPETLIGLKDNLQVVEAIDWLSHKFGVLGPSDHFFLPPFEGQSPIIMSGM